MTAAYISYLYFLHTNSDPIQIQTPSMLVYTSCIMLLLSFAHLLTLLWIRHRIPSRNAFAFLWSLLTQVCIFTLAFLIVLPTIELATTSTSNPQTTGKITKDIAAVSVLVLISTLFEFLTLMRSSNTANKLSYQCFSLRFLYFRIRIRTCH